MADNQENADGGDYKPDFTSDTFDIVASNNNNNDEGVAGNDGEFKEEVANYENEAGGYSANNANNNGNDDSNNYNPNDDDDGEERLEPEQYRKLFIGSLNYNTPEDTMRNYFGKYGDIVDCVIMKEPKTNRSRGFGFVTYSKSSMVDEVMKNRPHKLDGRELETKRATPREEAGKPGAELTVKKLFVGAIKEGLTEDHLKEYFSPYGAITDCVIMREKETNKSRGFGFVSFDDYDPVDKIVLEKYHTINGQSVAVKKALPKEQAGGPSGRFSRGGGNSGGRFNHYSGGGGGGDHHSGNFDHDDNYGNGNFGGNFNFNNMPNGFAQMAQKMFQAAAMQQQQQQNSYGKGRQTNFASDDFEGFQGFSGGNKQGGGGGGGGPMRSNQFRGRSGGPYQGGRKNFNNNNNNPNKPPPM